MRVLAFDLRFTVILVAGLLLGAVGCAPGVASAAVVDGDTASFEWQAASGPVAEYGVWVNRDAAGTGAQPDIFVPTPKIDVTGSPGETVAIRVAAFSASGASGPQSAESPTIEFKEAATLPLPPLAGVDVLGDVLLRDVLASADPGFQLSLRVEAEAPGEKAVLNVALHRKDELPPLFGFDQLVVGSPSQPTTLRLLDVAERRPGPPVTTIQLHGLGHGDPCDRTEPGLVIEAGSTLVLGGMDLFAFDGASCVYVNALFPGPGADPNAIDYAGGRVLLYGDLDEDGFLDPDDSCIDVANPSQCDTDGDGFGNHCDADFDDDGVVGVHDTKTLRLLMGATSSDPDFDPNVDLDCDGVVGVGDRGLFAESFGWPPGPSGFECGQSGPCPAP